MNCNSVTAGLLIETNCQANKSHMCQFVIPLFGFLSCKATLLFGRVCVGDAAFSERRRAGLQGDEPTVVSNSSAHIR